MHKDQSCNFGDYPGPENLPPYARDDYEHALAKPNPDAITRRILTRYRFLMCGCVDCVRTGNAHAYNGGR